MNQQITQSQIRVGDMVTVLSGIYKYRTGMVITDGEIYEVVFDDGSVNGRYASSELRNQMHEIKDLAVGTHIMLPSKGAYTCATVIRKLLEGDAEVIRPYMTNAYSTLTSLKGGMDIKCGYEIFIMSGSTRVQVVS